ncbi:MAG: hypothetical protein ACK4PR_00085, partial [Gammaproteobacteria bacterium]
QGYAVAQDQLSDRYQRGDGVPKNLEEAKKWYRNAAEQGYPPAQHKVGNMYSIGKGIPKNPQQAVIWYRKAAEQGYPPAQNKVGNIYLNGEGVPKDPQQAVIWYRKAADKGHAVAQNNLGVLYEQGEGVPKDPTEAAKWYRKAADQGYAIAQNNLGGLYVKGTGVEKNLEEAEKWYRKAADQRHPQAQYTLGIAYAKGIGVEKNLEEAAKWFELVIKQVNNPEHINWGSKTYYQLAEIYAELGKAEAAVIAYEIAAIKGLKQAQCRLGQLYMEGNLVPRNEATAIEWYKEAESQQDITARFNIGIIYGAGIGVPQNIEEAKRWLCLAAAHNHPLALYSLGKIFVGEWNNTQPDVIQAVEFFQRAASQENNAAKLIIDQIIQRVKNIHFSPKQTKGLQNILNKDEQQIQQLKNKRRDIYEQSIQGGNDAFAQYRLATIYEQENNISKAINYYQHAADNGYALAQYAMVRLCSEGHYDIEKNIMTVLKWIQGAASNNNEHMQAILGNIIEIIRHRLLLNDINYPLVTDWNRKPTKKELLGKKKLYFELAFRYEHGINCKIDKEEAGKYYEEIFADNGEKLLLQAAVYNNDKEAQFIVGHIFDDGYPKYKNSLRTFLQDIYQNDVLEDDDEEANIWYRRAAKQGELRAHNSLGLDENYEEAIKWFQCAADHGYAEAQYNLATKYEQDEEHDVDIAEAVKYYKLAAAQGHTHALFRLGAIFDFRQHNQKTEEIASALPTLWQYDDCDDTNKQYAEVIKWYGCAAEQGHADAAYRLAEIYEQGIGVDKSLEEAMKWSELAYKNGHAQAKQQLEALTSIANNIANLADQLIAMEEENNPSEEEHAKRKREEASSQTTEPNKKIKPGTNEGSITTAANVPGTQFYNNNNSVAREERVQLMEKSHIINKLQ